MRGLRDLPLRRKLISIILMTTGVAVLLAIAFLAVNDALTMRRTMTDELAALAEITAANSAAAVVFGDREAIEENLSFLSSQQHVEAAVIVDAFDSILGQYARPDQPPGEIMPATHRDHLDSATVTHLDVFKPIIVGGEHVGEVFLRGDMQRLRARLLWYATIASAVLLVSLLAALALGARLQRLVADPLLQLARTAQRISAEKNYEAHAFGDPGPRRRAGATPSTPAGHGGPSHRGAGGGEFPPHARQGERRAVGGEDGPPGLPRRPHRAAQPCPDQRPPDRGAGALAA